jgi:hypothetical protein
MLESIALIVGVASGILSSLQSAKSISGIQKTNISLLMEQIAGTLDLVVIKFKGGEVPHGACEELRMYAQNLSVLEGALSCDEVLDYTNKLMYAHNVEMLYVSVSNDPSQLIELEKAAGTFRAAAHLMKI